MSVITINDFIPPNLLNELNLNPVSEQLRGYSFAGSVACALLTFYLTLGDPKVHCVAGYAFDSNVSTEIATAGLSETETAYVNSQCSADEYLNDIRHAGLKMLAWVFAMQIVSSFWLHVPSVANGCRAFHEARKKLTDVVLTNNEIEKLITDVLPPKGGSDIQNKVRDACLLLSVHDSNRSIERWYDLRCLLLGIIPYFIFYEHYKIINAGSILCSYERVFKCRLNESREDVTFQNSYSCSVDDKNTVLVLTVVFLCTLAMQAFVMGTGLLYSAISRCKCKAYSERPLYFIEELQDSACPGQSLLLKKLIHHLFSINFGKVVKDKIAVIYTHEDWRLIEIKGNIFKETPEVISYLSDNFETVCGNVNREKYISAMKVAKYSIHDPDTVKLVRKLRRAKKWKMLITLLVESKEKQDVIEKLQRSTMTLRDLDQDECLKVYLQLVYSEREIEVIFEVHIENTATNHGISNAAADIVIHIGSTVPEAAADESQDTATGLLTSNDLLQM